MSTVGLPLDADGKPQGKAAASPLKRKREKKDAETEEADPPKSQPASPAAPAGDGTQVDEDQQQQDDKKANASPVAMDGESTPSAALKRLATAAEIKSENSADEKKDEDESAAAAPEAAPPKAKKPKADPAAKEKETDETEEDEKPKAKKTPVASKPKPAKGKGKGKGKAAGKRKTEAEILQGAEAKMSSARRRQGYDGCAGAVKALKRHYSNGRVDLDNPQSDSVFYGALATVARLANAKFGPVPHGSENMVHLVTARDDMGDALIAAGRAINEKQRGLEAAENGDDDAEKEAEEEEPKSTSAAEADE